MGKTILVTGIEGIKPKCYILLENNPTLSLIQINKNAVLHRLWHHTLLYLGCIKTYKDCECYTNKKWLDYIMCGLYIHKKTKKKTPADYTSAG